MSNYPVPHREGDRRLSSGLLAEVRTILLRHGFPELSRVDLMSLETALARFLYRPIDLSEVRKWPMNSARSSQASVLDD